MIMRKNMKEKAIVLFEEQEVRRVWNEKDEKWYFAISDIIQSLTGSINPGDYVKKMRLRDIALSKGWGQIVTPLYVKTSGGSQKVNCANVEGVLRIIQSIPSAKAEPFKLWLAKVGYERLQETVNPEMAMDRARKYWKNAGRSEKWIEQRMRGQETRNKLTDYWKEHDVKEGVEYASLTDIIHQEWTGLTTKQHKQIKKLRGQNLRDHMTEAELIFTALAELSTTHIAKSEQAEGYKKNARSAKGGGRIAADARKALEKKTGENIVSTKNFLKGKKKTLK